MKEMTTLSIIVPIYNVEKYIDECITSIVEQNANNIEVILINDGSTDGSRKICEDYCRKYKLEPKTMRMVSPKEGEAPNIVLIHCSAGGGKELKTLNNLIY